LINSRKNPIKALIELPNWLGDCVMSTPAIENIVSFYRDIEITIIGSFNSVELLKNHPKVVKVVTIESKKKLPLKTFSGLGSFDIYFSFRGSIRARATKLIVNAKKKYQYGQFKSSKSHQVEKYVDFVNYSLNINLKAGNLVSYIHKKNNSKTSKILGINPGASYGSAKRWYPKEFSKIAIELSGSFDIMIFGGMNELDFANEIESLLKSKDIHNFTNLAGKTSIYELSSYIGNLDVLVTGDSGPMHIAASLQVPTISLFGPTNPVETSQWKNIKSLILKKNLDCQPCMQRICPLKHHNCMKYIEASEVIESITKLS
tara:strand:- start:1814 stop:2764 length:951 start_codon:yes stop_codon:yes gene_type:complete